MPVRMSHRGLPQAPEARIKQRILTSVVTCLFMLMTQTFKGGCITSVSIGVAIWADDDVADGCSDCKEQSWKGLRIK